MPRPANSSVALTLRPVRAGTSTVAPNMANMCWKPSRAIFPGDSFRLVIGKAPFLCVHECKRNYDNRLSPDITTSTRKAQIETRKPSRAQGFERAEGPSRGSGAAPSGRLQLLPVQAPYSATPSPPSISMTWTPMRSVWAVGTFLPTKSARMGSSRWPRSMSTARRMRAARP